MKKFFGGLFLVVGFIIAALSGLCSLVVFAGSLTNNASNILPLIGLFGGIPFATGMALFWIGKWMKK